MDDKLIARAKLIFERNNSSPLFLITSDYYLRNNEPQTAISILEKGLKTFPEHPLAFILMGKANFALGNIKLAEHYINRASDLLNSNETLTYYRKEFKLQDKHTSPFDSSRGNIFFNSLKNYSSEEETPENKPKSVEDMLPQIADKLINARIEQNSNFTPGEINQQNYSPDKSKLATETFANIYLSQGQKDEAIKIYELLLQRNPEKKDYYLNKINEIRSQ